MDMTPVFQKMGVLLLILCVGYFLFKIQIIDVPAKRKMTKLLLFVTSPALIIDSFLDNAASGGALDGIMPWVFLTAVAMFAGLAIVSWPLVKLIRAPRKQKGLYMMMTVFGNIGFIGFPVISAVSEALWGKGSDSVGLFYGAIFCCVFNVLVYTLGVFLMHWGTGEGEESLRDAIRPKKLLTPGVISCAVGVVLFLFRIPLPGVICDTVDSLGALTGTLAMLLVGANLAEMPLRSIVTDVRAMLYAVIRQFALPLLAWPLIRWAIPGDGGAWTQLAVVTLVMVGMPVANMAALFATEYGGDEALAARTIFLTTVLSMASIPVILLICL